MPADGAVDEVDANAPLRHAYKFVSSKDRYVQQHLYNAQVGAVIQQMRGESVT